MTTAMVLCAGFGTRLRPLTDDMPKALMPVGDQPVVAHVAAALRRGGIAAIVANTHYLSGEIAAKITILGGDLRLTHEAEILGTAGGVAHAAPLLGPGDVLVWNGDIWAPRLDVAELIRARAAGDSDALWVVEPLSVGKGTVGLDEAGYVVRLRGETFGKETSGGNFLGVQMLGAKLRAMLPARGCLVADVALPLLRRGGRIATFVHEGPWDDVGDPIALLQANLRWLAQNGLPAWKAHDAEVAPGVQLTRSIVGAGAVVRGAGELRDCVVFPGASLNAPSARVLAGRRTRLDVAGASVS